MTILVRCAKLIELDRSEKVFRKRLYIRYLKRRDWIEEVRIEYVRSN